MIFAFLAFGFLLGSGVAAAQASTLYSDVGQYTVNGITYDNQASIGYGTGSGQLSAETDTWTDNGSTVGTGWMGMDARGFFGGTECAESGWYYNTDPNSWAGVYVNFNCGTFSNYYSWGVTEYWNGGGYSPVYTYRHAT